MSSPIYALVQLDLRERLRNPRAWIILALVALVTWAVLPDPSSTYSLVRVDRHHVIFDSSSNALGSVSLATLFFFLVGLYLLRGQSQREADRGIAPLLGCLPVSTATLVVSRWLAGVSYLLLLSAVHLLMTIAVHVLRSDVPVSISTYLIVASGVLLPTCVAVSSFAMIFESFPALHARLGDVLAFFLWAVMSSVTITLVAKGVTHWVHVFDGSGLATMVVRVQQTIGHSNFQIGTTVAEAAKLPGMHLPQGIWQIEWWALRMLAALVYCLPLLLAFIAFHRFNPDRLRARSPHASRLGRLLRRTLRPLQALASAILPRLVVLPAPLRRISTEILLTAMTRAWAIPAFVILAFVQIFGQSEMAKLSALLAFGLAGMLVADLQSRHQRHQLSGLRHAIAGMQQGETRDAVFAALFWAALAAAPVMLLNLEIAPLRSAHALIGMFLLAASACLSDRFSGSGKLFSAACLLILYMALNAKDVALLDIGGVTGAGTAESLSIHSLTAAVLMTLALWRKPGTR